MKSLAFIFLLLSLARSEAPVTLNGVASFKGTATLSAAGTAPLDPVFNSVTHVWHLEEPSGTPRVDVIGGKTLTESVAVPNAVGIHGNAADFRSLTTGSMASSAFASATPISVAYWVKPTQASAGGEVFFQVDPIDGQMDSVFDFTGGDYTALGGFGGDCDNFGSHPISSFLNNWHLIVMTFATDGTGNLYIDGSLDPDSGIGSCPLTISGPLTLGNTFNGAIGGLIDELMIFNTALDQTGVTALLTHFYSP